MARLDRPSATRARTPALPAREAVEAVVSPPGPDELLDHGRIDSCSSGADALGGLDQFAALRDAVLQQVTDAPDACPEHPQGVVGLQVLRQHEDADGAAGTGP